MWEGEEKSFELLSKFLGFRYLPVFPEWFLQMVLLEIKLEMSVFSISKYVTRMKTFVRLADDTFQ